MISIEIKPYQKKFINFLVKSEVLTFGDFTTKSGRKTPYFVNTGKFLDGARITEVGDFYAKHLQSENLTNIDTVFGPAYKGVPLCVATASALFRNYEVNIGYTFNRKEAKQHGDKGNFVGKKIIDKSSLVIVEDVITAGTTLREIVPILRAHADVKIKAVVIAVDRCEKGTGEISAAQEAEQDLELKVLPLVNIHQIKSYLSTPNESGLTLTDEILERMKSYLAEYGASS